MRPVLFISHDAGRTGAPMVVLNLCRWLAAHHPRTFEVALGDGGDLEGELAALAPTSVIGRLADPTGAAGRLRALGDRVRRGEFSLVYANTIETGEILDACASATTPVITHVHELEFWIRHRTGSERFGLVQDHSDRFIAVSDAVRTNLVTNHGMSAEVIDLVHEFIDTTRWQSETTPRSPLLQALGIPDSAFIVGGSGTLDWRKAPDLFVQVAGAVHRRGTARSVHWVWVGGESDGESVAGLRHDAERLGLGTTVHFLGAQREPAPLFASFDVFVSSSREDPYPLVNLEAAASATPIVCFDGAGGAREFVEHDCGAVVPYLDIAAMADRVSELLASHAARRRAGARARVKVCARHDVSVAGPQLAEVIERTIASGPTTGRLTRQVRRASAPAVAARFIAGDGALLVLYREASACASAGETVRARTLFESIAHASTRNPELAGKAWFKLANLSRGRDEALRCCERALQLLPAHRAARELRGQLLSRELSHG